VILTVVLWLIASAIS